MKEPINTLAMYAFLWRLQLHAFNLTELDKDYCTQDEIGVLVVYELLQEYKSQTEKLWLKCTFDY